MNALSAFCALILFFLGERKVIWFMTNLCHLSQKVSLSEQMAEDTQESQQNLSSPGKQPRKMEMVTWY